MQAACIVCGIRPGEVRVVEDERNDMIALWADSTRGGSVSYQRKLTRQAAICQDCERRARRGRVLRRLGVGLVFLAIGVATGLAGGWDAKPKSEVLVGISLFTLVGAAIAIGM